MTEPFILDPDYVDFTPDKLKYETVIPEDLRSFVEGYWIFVFIWGLIVLGVLLAFSYTELIVTMKESDSIGASIMLSGFFLMMILLAAMGIRSFFSGRITLLLSLSIFVITAISLLLDTDLFTQLMGYAYIIYVIGVLVVLGSAYLKNLYRYLKLRNYCVRMVNYGVLIDGEVIESTREYKPANEYLDDCYVTVRYKYMTLSGYDREGTQRWKRNDLKQKTLPSKGTPVKVLYADEKAVIML